MPFIFWQPDAILIIIPKYVQISLHDICDNIDDEMIAERRIL